MKYIDRAQTGIALFFDQLSDLTAADTPDTPEDCVEILRQQSYSAQTEECRRIQGALRRLMSARYTLKDRIPARVQMVATSQFTPTPDRLLPVFQWVQELHAANAQARMQGQYALQDVGYRLGGCADAFLQAFSKLAAQRVSLLAKDDALTLAIPDSLWGQAALRFTGIQSRPPEDAAFGYLFWIEADYADGVYEFRLLLDTDFSDTLYQERLLQSDNWSEITIKCTEAQLDVRTCDYAARIEALGLGGTDGVLLGLTELGRKQVMLGTSALSAGESALFGVSEICTALELIPSTKLVKTSHEYIEQVLGNRYLVEESCKLFRSIGGVFAEKLAKLLTDAMDQYENEALTACTRTLNRIRSGFQAARESGDDLVWADGICQMLREATKPYGAIFPFSAQYNDISAQIDAKAGVLLRRVGFDGKYPNYTRIRGKWAHFVTFTSDGVPTATDDGQVLLQCGVAVAKCKIGRDGKLCSVPPKRLSATALDKMAENGARFGLVFHPDQDGVTVTFPYGFHDCDAARESQAKAAAAMATAAAIAVRALDGKRLPLHYRPHRPGQLRAQGAFTGLLMRTLPLMSPVAAAALGVQFVLNRASFRMETAVAWAIAVGFGTVCWVTIFRYLHLRRTIWNR